MSVLATPIRGLRMMTIAVVVMMLRYALELALVAWSLGVDSLDDIASLLTWLARLRLLDLAALTLLIVGVASNLGELRRRRLSVTTGVIALVTFVLTFAVHAWMYDLLTDLAAGFRGEGSLLGRTDELERVPTRTFLATIAYVAGLFATVLMVRGYALTDGNLALREAARVIGGLLVLLLIADTFYRFTYGLGGSATAFGILGLAAAIGLSVFWFWCHRRLGHLFDTAKYYLRATADIPIAEVRPAATPSPRAVTRPPSPVAAAANPPAPRATSPIAAPPAIAAPPSPLVAPATSPPPSASPSSLPPAAPTSRLDESTPPTDGGPRFLR
jgi:hypothetical protein